MRILMMTIVLLVGLAFATTGFAGNDAEMASDANEAAAEETAPTENPAVAAPAATDDPAPAEETEADAE